MVELFPAAIPLGWRPVNMAVFGDPTENRPIAETVRWLGGLPYVNVAQSIYLNKSVLCGDYP